MPFIVALHLPFLLRGGFRPEEDVVSIRRAWGKALLTCVAVAGFAGSFAIAQQANVEEGKRKAKTKASPVYPELARRLGITGKVKVEVIVAPDGRVKNARAIGGHPVLVQACVDAVKDWRFESAPEETTQIIEFDFRQ
jgi:TonB family protein